MFNWWLFTEIVDNLEDAMKLSGDEFRAKYGFIKPTPAGEAIIVYCRSGARAGRAGKILRDQFGYFKSVKLFTVIQ